MTASALALAFTFLISTGSSAVASGRTFWSKPDVYRLVAEAIEFGDLCNRWTLDTNSLSRFLAYNDMKIDDEYSRQVMANRVRLKATIGKLPSRDGCEAAVAAFGPNGSKVANLLTLR